jgi:hypothetical protein
MGRDTLERKATRAVIRMDEKVSDICNTLYDINLKLCHIIKSKNDYYHSFENDNYMK